jgi:hypothetical protein
VKEIAATTSLSKPIAFANLLRLHLLRLLLPNLGMLV